MTSALMVCPACEHPLGPEFWNKPELAPCPSCLKPVQAFAFPALIQPAKPASVGEQLQETTEAACFFHPSKRAVVPCDQCGRFLCSLCEIELHGQHLCPSCLEAGRTKGKVKELKNVHTRHDQMALTCALLPLIPVFLFALVLTAPITIYLCIRYRKAPLGLTQRSRAGLWVAAAVGSLELAGVILFLVTAFSS